MSIRTSCCPCIRQTIIKVLLIKAPIKLLLSSTVPCLEQRDLLWTLGSERNLLNWSSTNTAMVLLHAKNTEEHVIECKKPYSKLCKKWLWRLLSDFQHLFHSQSATLHTMVMLQSWRIFFLEIRPIATQSLWTTTVLISSCYCIPSCSCLLELVSVLQLFCICRYII